MTMLFPLWNLIQIPERCLDRGLPRGSGPRPPEDDGSVGGGGEEGLVVGVPSTLDHFIQVLSCHRLGEGLGEVACG